MRAEPGDCYLVENNMNAMSRKEADACVEESLAYDDASGRPATSSSPDAPQPVERATTIRVRNGNPSGLLLGAADQGASPVRRMR
jgi:hypothetical protein